MLTPALIFWLVLTGGVLAGALVLVAALARHKKGAARELVLTGRVGSVVEALRPEGAVLVGGELWRARLRAGGTVERGRVRVVGARGVYLEVEAEP
ncbi:MAG TPA: NfeD family protein [Pyrinomonadaceae bacterium]|jgi:membrane-bound ClpP family serine protease